MNSETLSIGIDIGGTFTDVVCRLPDGTLQQFKLPSTRANPAQAVRDAVAFMVREWKIAPADIGRFVHGTTVATNAVLERKGAKVGLILEQVDTFRLSYAKTLKLWREKFLDRWQVIKKLGYTEEFKRKWLYYLAYCEAGFAEGSIDVGIYQYRKPV